jgi:hypothetical protein
LGMVLSEDCGASDRKMESGKWGQGAEVRFHHREHREHGGKKRSLYADGRARKALA